MTSAIETPAGKAQLLLGRLFFISLAVVNLVKLAQIIDYSQSPDSFLNISLIDGVAKLLLISIGFLAIFLTKNKRNFLLWLLLSIGIKFLNIVTVLSVVTLTWHNKILTTFQWIIGSPTRVGFNLQGIGVAFGFNSGGGIKGSIFELFSTFDFFVLITNLVLILILLISKTGKTSSSIKTHLFYADVSTQNIDNKSFVSTAAESSIEHQANQLEKFGLLYKEGLMTKAEFDKKKREILGE